MRSGWSLRFPPPPPRLGAHEPTLVIFYSPDRGFVALRSSTIYAAFATRFPRDVHVVRIRDLRPCFENRF